jgi:hypothetical protein
MGRTASSPRASVIARRPKAKPAPAKAGEAISTLRIGFVLYASLRDRFSHNPFAAKHLSAVCLSGNWLCFARFSPPIPPVGRGLARLAAGQNLSSARWGPRSIVLTPGRWAGIRTLTVTPEPSGLATPDSRLSGNAAAEFSQYLTNGPTQGQEIFSRIGPRRGNMPDSQEGQGLHTPEAGVSGNLSLWANSRDTGRKTLFFGRRAGGLSAREGMERVFWRSTPGCSTVRRFDEVYPCRASGRSIDAAAISEKRRISPAHPPRVCPRRRRCENPQLLPRNIIVPERLPGSFSR